MLVVNETRVVRARLRGVREPGGGAAEILLLRPAGGGAFDLGARDWHALVRPGRRLRAGARVRFGDDATAEILGARPDGSRLVHFETRGSLAEILERHGEMPLPPYVGAGDEARARRYQTIFARVPGSVAAPTASLHFTPPIVAAIEARGVTIDEHAMHAERYDIPPGTAGAVNAAKREGRRVVAAGTTVLRALEASAQEHGGQVDAGAAETALFVTPGFRFRVVDALLTNFHLPASTLLVLVSAFGGYDRIVTAYHAAVEKRYRFFSFGDAMFLELDEGATR